MGLLTRDLAGVDEDLDRDLTYGRAPLSTTKSSTTSRSTMLLSSTARELQIPGGAWRHPPEKAGNAIGFRRHEPTDSDIGAGTATR
jgi:hypothetical protein